MSKAIVNMTPNPSDIQTIHCSQGDTEAREWEFELHNNGEVIDAGGITEQMVFKSYEGGTEQILPENGSTPTTSPFKGNIKYPQGLLSDQEFLYRESPTEEDGLAKITDIKGNTLVWNQLVQNGNFADTSNWSATDATLTASNNVLNVKTTRAWSYLKNSAKYPITNGHKYYIKVEAQKTIASDSLVMAFNTYPSVWADQTTYYFPNDTKWNKYEGIKVANATGSIDKIGLDSGSATEYNVKNVMLIDLTQMGLDSVTVEQFTSLFSEPYYDYCQGAMLSFGGRNVKFNQLVSNGNFESTNGWGRTRVTLSASNNELTVTVSEASTGRGQRVFKDLGINDTHTRLYSVEMKATSGKTLSMGSNTQDAAGYNILASATATGSWQKLQAISSLNHAFIMFGLNNDTSIGDSYQVRNVQVFDLTEMFGVGNEPSTEGFLELFPNDYYEYTTGQYMNIGQPVSLKTVGKNRLNYDEWKTVATRNGTSVWENNGVTITATSNDAYTLYGASTFPVNARIPVREGETITLSWESDDNVNGDVYIFPNGGSAGFVFINNRLGKSLSYTPVEGVEYVTIRFGVASSGNTIHFKNIMVRYDDTDSTYEPYAESALSIPLDEFPDGMDGINDARDEKNETGYAKRIGRVDLGSLNYNYAVSSGVNYFFSTSIPVPAQPVGEMSNVKSSLYTPKTVMNTIGEGLTKNMTMVVSATGFVCFRNDDITSATAFKSAMSGVYLYYELVTPLENYGVVDLGSLTWTAVSTNTSGVYRMRSDGLQGLVKNTSSTSEVANIICPLYAATGSSANYRCTKGIAIETNGMLFVYDENYNASTSPESFKQAMSGVYLLYEKANPQGFTTATLVTENGEVALANENGVLVGKCNSDVSADAGFIEGKIKLSDEDGDVYSNKIQIHVERMPE